MQAQLGEKAVTGVVSMAVSEEGSETHFEAFQVHENPPAAVLMRPQSPCSWSDHRSKVFLCHPQCHACSLSKASHACLHLLACWKAADIDCKATCRSQTRRCGCGRRAGSRLRQSLVVFLSFATPR